MKLLVAVSPGEVRVAAVDGSGVVDYALWRPGRPDGVGDLYRGRITARQPALGGAFVTLGSEDGFLPERDGGTATVGSILGLRVVRAAQGGKGVRLTADLTDAERASVGQGPIGLLQRGPHAVERLAALHPDAEITIDDAALCAELRARFGARLHLVAQAFDGDIAAQIADLAAAEITLAGGARMAIHPTAAVTAIDLDLASGITARGNKRNAHEAANRAAIPALARQIRLRNLGGGIVIDLAGLSVKRRAALAPSLATALADDPLAPRFLGFSALGLAEVLRPRVHPPLHELLATPHAAGLAALRDAAASVAADPATALALIAAPAVIGALQSDPIALAQFTHRAGRALLLRADRNRAPRAWTLEPL